MKKIDSARQLIQKYSDIFKCPLCGARMQIKDASHSLLCAHRHCFDISRHGYINLLPGQVKPTKYNKTLFTARYEISQRDFFREINEQVLALARPEIRHAPSGRVRILDAGCGEGSHLAALVTGLQATVGGEVLGVGIDIAKEGISLAARQYPGLIWCVANLAHSPLRDKQCDVLLNIFSPSNYAEFTRMLTDDGLLIKVVPGSDYLKELRQVFYARTPKQTYSNETVLTLLEKHFALLAVKQVKYTKNLDQAGLEHLVQMTPLSWRATEENKKTLLQAGVSSITVDAAIVAGRKRTRIRNG